MATTSNADSEPRSKAIAAGESSGRGWRNAMSLAPRARLERVRSRGAKRSRVLAALGTHALRDDAVNDLALAFSLRFAHKPARECGARGRFPAATLLQAS